MIVCSVINVSIKVAYISCRFFNHLDDATMKLITERTKHLKMKKGEFLYNEGDTEQALYIVFKGQIKVYKLMENGKEQLLRILKPGDFTGEWALFDQQGTHEDFAENLTDVEICMLHQKDMQALLTDYPTISLSLLSEMSKRLQTSQRQTSRVMLPQIGERLALYLLDLLDESETNSLLVQLAMSRRYLASYLGTTPESISRQFKKLEELGFIEQRQTTTLKIIDQAGLRWYTEENKE